MKSLKTDGCTPSESFCASTLKCFYEQSCINLIQKYTNYTKHIAPLSVKMNRSSINTTVAEFISNLFVKQLLTTMNYSSYFEQCSPWFCSTLPLWTQHQYYTTNCDVNIYFTYRTILLGGQRTSTIS
ncbi:hypothetical protein I4U23_027374 [Adineta vaga]|nr:hypothetical protein I4U23_027374 [Adineta vaga]